MEAEPALNAADEPTVGDKLRALKQLHDRHLLSDSEYQSRRERLMSQSKGAGAP